jgi:Ca2+-binding RTX toxin-like protein
LGPRRQPTPRFGRHKTLAGGPGNDGHWGGIGSDTVLGGSGDDFVHGENGSDRAVVGGEGRDFVDGGRGSDRMLGQGGGDWILDGPFEESSKDDTLSGGAGDDILLSDHVPAVRDIVSCGGGFDRLIADRMDVVADDCERVRIVHGTEAEVMKQEEAFIESLPKAELEFWGTFFERLAPDPTAGG